MSTTATTEILSAKERFVTIAEDLTTLSWYSQHSVVTDALNHPERHDHAASPVVEIARRMHETLDRVDEQLGALLAGMAASDVPAPSGIEIEFASVREHLTGDDAAATAGSWITDPHTAGEDLQVLGESADEAAAIIRRWTRA